MVPPGSRPREVCAGAHPCQPPTGPGRLGAAGPGLTPVLPWVLLTLVSLGVLLVAEVRGLHGLQLVSKPLASVGFVGLGLVCGALSSLAGHVLFVGLLCCMLGDLALMGKGRGWFLAGLVVFLLGHVAYALAFGLAGLELVWALVTLGVVAAVAVPVMRWLWPHLPRPMRGPVVAYVLVISAMVAAAAGAVGAGASGWLGLGAVLFYLSDLFVARQRFVVKASLNRLLGLPLYYGGQLLLAGQAGL